MAKDLRTLLEPAHKASKGGKDSVPLAQRRSLTSPGEPRVFRVRAGYVCGLCGRLHDKLEPAFDCLSRCTIQLRLRTPAGRSFSGQQTHYACTACGRGFANTDDAEECFERCLAKIKPGPEFEKALRRVQVRYVQRLQNHGVRPLDRIDAFSEHSRMLNTLTQEQSAMGRSAATVQQKPAPAASRTTQNQTASRTAIDTLAAHTPAPSAVMPSTAAPSMTEPSATPGQQLQQLRTAEKQEQDLGQNILPKTGDTELETSPQQTSGSQFIIEGSVPDQPNTQISAHGFTTEDSGSDNNIELELTASLDSSEPEVNLNDLDISAPSGDDLLEELNTPENAENRSFAAEKSQSFENELDSLLEQSLSDDFSNEPATKPESALSLLTTTTSPDDLSNNRLNTNADEFSLDFMQDGTDELSNALAEASEFAQVAEQPETNLLAADVLALLQTSASGEEVALSKSQEKQIASKKIEVDPNLLDRLTETDADDDSLGRVFLRKPDMKTYRRNNAKYCCSACTKEFFTKEQVEACFYAHPEEGSEEARLLLERAKKTSTRTAA